MSQGYSVCNLRKPPFPILTKALSPSRDSGSRVLVHCKMGISRSASCVMAYAMKALGLSLEEARAVVKGKRAQVKPNHAFQTQLKIYQVWIYIKIYQVCMPQWHFSMSI